MRTTLRFVAATALIMVAAVGLAACGDDDETAAAASSTPDTSEMHSSSAAPASAAADLRVTLDRLLGEHAMLAVVAMQKGFDGDADFDAATAALDENSVELADAVGSVYGGEARTEFLRLWRRHIGFFVDYTVATAEKDEQARMAALDELDGYRQAFARFLAGANPNLEAPALADLLQSHVGQLTAALDTYAAGDHATAYDQWREAYAHMFMTGDALAGAIATQFPEKFGS